MIARHLESAATDPDAFLFVGSRGAPLRYHAFRRAIWDPAIDAAGLSDYAGLFPNRLEEIVVAFDAIYESQAERRSPVGGR